MLRRSLAGILSTTSRSGGGGVLQLLSSETSALPLSTASLLPGVTTRWASAIPQAVLPEPTQVIYFFSN
jgi:hypothetical protein